MFFCGNSKRSKHIDGGNVAIRKDVGVYIIKDTHYDKGDILKQVAIVPGNILKQFDGKSMTLKGVYKSTWLINDTVHPI